MDSTVLLRADDRSNASSEGRGQRRHYGMDWLRIGAFQLLILYHVGMAFGPWDYQVKAANPPVAWATIPLLLSNPWRLSLLFVVSGYASAALFARQRGGIGAFVRSRIVRLGLPLLFGMAVILTPQPWVWLVTHYGYDQGFATFLVRDYYRFQSIHGVIVPTWMHLWFVAYLLAYTFVLAALLALPASWRAAGRRLIERLMAGPGLLPLGILLVYAARSYPRGDWYDSHLLIDDWSAHAHYLPMFLFGYLLRGSRPLSWAIGRSWISGALIALLGWLVLAWFELGRPWLSAPPLTLWPIHRSARAAESWGAIVALLGFADRYLSIDSRWRPMLAEAVFPFYLVHQTIIIVVGYWLTSTDTGPLVRFLILLSATAVGSWLFYLAGREIRWLRPLIGLKTLSPVTTLKVLAPASGLQRRPWLRKDPRGMRSTSLARSAAGRATTPGREGPDPA